MMTQVTETVFIGDKQDAADEEALDHHSINYVVTLAEPKLNTTTDYHPLTDGKNKQAEFDAAVDTVKSYITEETPVLVHCRMGRSRSPTVVATALAAVNSEQFTEGLEPIHDTGRFVNPERHLIDHARTYLDEPSYEESFGQ